MASKKVGKQMRELAQLAYERDLTRSIEDLQEQMKAWQAGKMTVWEIEQDIHIFHNKTARSLYKSYVMTDSILAVAIRVAKGVISLNDVPEEERKKIQDIAVHMNHGE
jgi:hypothetical protein